MEIIGIRKAQSSGLSSIIRLAENEGVVIITSNSKPVAMITPLSLTGLMRHNEKMNEVFSSEDFQETLSDNDKEFVGVITKTLNLSVSKLLEQRTMFDENKIALG